MYLLSGMVTNPDGDVMTGRPDRGAGRQPRRCYATRAPATPSLSVGADALEELIVEAVLLRLDEVVLPTSEAVSPTGDVEAIEAELAELAALRGAGTVSLAEWMVARSPLLVRLDQARTAAGHARRPSSLLRELGTPGAVRRRWPDLTLAARRQVLTAAIERVVMGAASRGRWTPLEERVDVTWKV